VALYSSNLGYARRATLRSLLPPLSLSLSVSLLFAELSPPFGHENRNQAFSVGRFARGNGENAGRARASACQVPIKWRLELSAS